MCCLCLGCEGYWFEYMGAEVGAFVVGYRDRVMSGGVYHVFCRVFVF